MSYYTCLSSQGGDTALVRAAWEGETEVVMELIEAGAKLNLQNEVQRLSILCMCTTYIQHMMYMNTTCNIQVIRASLHYVYFIYIYMYVLL